MHYWADEDNIPPQSTQETKKLSNSLNKDKAIWKIACSRECDAMPKMTLPFKIDTINSPARECKELIPPMLNVVYYFIFKLLKGKKKIRE